MRGTSIGRLTKANIRKALTRRIIEIAQNDKNDEPDKESTSVRVAKIPIAIAFIEIGEMDFLILGVARRRSAYKILPRTFL